jgi:hypothetical protein
MAAQLILHRIILNVYTDKPGIHVYTGNYLMGMISDTIKLHIISTLVFVLRLNMFLTVLTLIRR